MNLYAHITIHHTPVYIDIALGVFWRGHFDSFSLAFSDIKNIMEFTVKQNVIFSRNTNSLQISIHRKVGSLENYFMDQISNVLDRTFFLT
jgi:phage head maturation protease